MRRCYFCGATDIEIHKIKYEGKDNGKRRQKTIDVCVCCDAHSDDEWCRERFGWDYYTWAGYRD